MSTAVVLICVAVAGCTTYDHTRHYDTAASEQAAKVVEKRKFTTRAQPAADSKTNMAFIPIPHAGRFVMVALSFTLTHEASIDVYEYTVEGADGQRVPVYNDFRLRLPPATHTSAGFAYPRISRSAPLGGRSITLSLSPVRR
jgi:hypothetical protein